MNPYDEIIKLLDTNGIDYELQEHDPVIGVEDAQRVTGREPEEGGKALIIKADGEPRLFVVKGINRLDSKKVRNHLGIRKFRFATPEEVKELTGVEVGAVYPFGTIMKLPMLVDETLKDNDYINFSPGVHDKHIRMKMTDYIKVTQPEFADIVQ